MIRRVFFAAVWMAEQRWGKMCRPSLQLGRLWCIPERSWMNTQCQDWAGSFTGFLNYNCKWLPQIRAQGSLGEFLTHPSHSLSSWMRITCPTSAPGTQGSCYIPHPQGCPDCPALLSPQTRGRRGVPCRSLGSQGHLSSAGLAFIHLLVSLPKQRWWQEVNTCPFLPSARLRMLRGRTTWSCPSIWNQPSQHKTKAGAWDWEEASQHLPTFETPAFKGSGHRRGQNLCKQPLIKHRAC